MARLAIAKGFLAEYAKLDQDARLAVETVVTEFARRPHAWRYLERPRQALDDRIRLFRVNSLWRGVVLAPASGDTYCLITILPHEKAYAYAAGHRFGVNQALGVLEAHDEETIRQLRPALQPAAQPDGRRLFADVTDAGLTRLGVDAQVLPVVRLLASEADLERLQLALPDAQYAALCALSCGMTVDEARAEVARLSPVGPTPEHVDQGDLVAAMERSPDQVTFVSGPQELPRILAHPFAAWRTFLHPSQREIAYRPSYAGPAQVTGGPGTGKTVTVLHRAAFLAARAATSPEAEPQAIGVAARSASLVREAREALKADGIMTVPLRGRGDTQAVRVGTMHAMKGLEFQAVAVIGVEQGLVPQPAAITAESEDAVTHAQDLQRERCVLFAACTRARDHLFVSGTGAPSLFLPDDARIRPDSLIAAR